MRLFFNGLLFAVMLSAGGMTQAADSQPITVAPDRNCHMKCAKTARICTADGKTDKDCSRVIQACTRACNRR
jgi:hypothetical protein